MNKWQKGDHVTIPGYVGVAIVRRVEESVMGVEYLLTDVNYEAGFRKVITAESGDGKDFVSFDQENVPEYILSVAAAINGDEYPFYSQKTIYMAMEKYATYCNNMKSKDL